jgi:hypothetical protein
MKKILSFFVIPGSCPVAAAIIRVRRKDRIPRSPALPGLPLHDW